MFIFVVIFSMTLKQKIYSHYLQVINNKVKLLQQALNELKEIGSNETKSTAGDKHETALAMVQIEQANFRGQLKAALEQKAAFEKLNPKLSVPLIVNGSVIKTSKGYLFLSIALGKAIIDGVSIIALSPQSPLGMQLLGLSVTDVVVLNDNRYVIESIE
jgi:hypothetical protein